MCGMECAALTPGSKKLEKIILYQHSFFHRLYRGVIFRFIIFITLPTLLLKYTKVKIVWNENESMRLIEVNSNIC